MNVMTFREYVQQARRDYITAVLKAAGQNVRKASDIAHMNRTQMHKYIARLGIKVDRGNSRYGNRGNAEWQALVLADRLQTALQRRATSMLEKCQHD